MALRYLFESGGFTVLMDGQFIGRVIRSLSACAHSNGRPYMSYTWAAFSSVNKGSTFHHRTRAEAGQSLLRAVKKKRMSKIEKHDINQAERKKAL